MKVPLAITDSDAELSDSERIELSQLYVTIERQQQRLTELRISAQVIAKRGRNRLFARKRREARELAAEALQAEWEAPRRIGVH